jgi:hypothetical protein
MMIITRRKMTSIILYIENLIKQEEFKYNIAKEINYKYIEQYKKTLDESLFSLSQMQCDIVIKLKHFIDHYNNLLQSQYRDSLVNNTVTTLVEMYREIHQVHSVAVAKSANATNLYLNDLNNEEIIHYCQEKIRFSTFTKNILECHNALVKNYIEAYSKSTNNIPPIQHSSNEQCETQSQKNEEETFVRKLNFDDDPGQTEEETFSINEDNFPMHEGELAFAVEGDNHSFIEDDLSSTIHETETMIDPFIILGEPQVFTDDEIEHILAYEEDIESNPVVISEQPVSWILEHKAGKRRSSRIAEINRNKRMKMCVPLGH